MGEAIDVEKSNTVRKSSLESISSRKSSALQKSSSSLHEDDLQFSRVLSSASARRASSGSILALSNPNLDEEALDEETPTLILHEEDLKEEDKSSKARYRDLFRDRNIVMFAILTFFYHLFNAGVLPLLAQLLAVENSRNGLAFTSGSMCLTYVVQAPTSFIVGLTYKRFGYKNMLMVALIILPVRCLNLALLAIYFPNQYALAATQFWEGLGAGIYDTLIPLVVKALVEGSGRFGFTFGFILTCWRLGHGFSVLLAEAVLKAAHEQYQIPFFVMGAGGIMVCLLLQFGVNIPSPHVGEPKGIVSANQEASDNEVTTSK